MRRLIAEFPSQASLVYLSRLLLEPLASQISSAPREKGQERMRLDLARHEFEDLLALAHSNHVVVRGFGILLKLASGERNPVMVEWVEGALSSERVRIARGLYFLNEICTAFRENGLTVAVIKSLDHWPDFGSDLDLYITASSDDVTRLMSHYFSASIAARSWGDHLAQKWNYFLPDLPEAVEIHVGRLGQTGEQVTIASTLASRTRQVHVGGYFFRVPSTSDRLIISTLQRMYRHFNFRLCDILDTASIADAGFIDYENLRMLASIAGIWEGAATYLRIVSDYVKTYRGTGLDLPEFVLAAARFSGDEIYYDQGFLRVPIMPHSARLYRSELAHVLGRGELHNGVRLGLLPLLGTAAAAKQRLTGSDKGIW